MSTPPVVRIINRGKGHSYEIDGAKTDGTTTIINDGYPKPGLIGWAANITRKCVMDRWDELVLLRPSERDDILYRARFDHRDEAAERGKRAHDLVYRFARGDEVDVSDELRGYLDAWQAFDADWDPRFLLLETPVFSFEFNYAGTLDAVAELVDGRRWLLDWKTGKDVYNDVALQLAAYRYADVYLDADGETKPMLPVDACASVWIQDGAYELRPVDVTPETFDVFGAVQQVAQWRAAYDPRSGPGALGEALQPPEVIPT
jgi:hypothetical protein